MLKPFQPQEPSTQSLAMSAVEPLPLFKFSKVITSELKKFKKQYAVFAYIGTPGCGKMTALRHVFPDIEEFPGIDTCIKNDKRGKHGGKIHIEETIQLCKKLQPNLVGTTLWAIKQAELFSEESITHIIQQAKESKVRIILVSNNVVAFTTEDKKRCLYMHPHNSKKLKQFVMEKWNMAAEDAVSLVDSSGNDLRQMHMNYMMTLNGTSDKSKHTHFDTQKS